MKKKLVLAGLLLLALNTASAMSLLVEGDSLFATGPVEDDLVPFTTALDRPEVKRVVFVNSVGGNLWTGMRVGQAIAEKNIDTVVAGYCISACYIMFQGGRQRTFSNAFKPSQTFVGIHGPSGKDSKLVNARAAPQIYAFMKQRMGDRFNATLMNKALYDMDDSGAMLWVYEGARSPVRPTRHCKSSQTLPKDCTEFKDDSALSLGVVTSNELSNVTLPESMQEKLVIGDYKLDSRIQKEDADAFLKTLSDFFCESEQCHSMVAGYPTLTENKALATPLVPPGLGYANNQDNLFKAYANAIYFCNHVKNRRPRLCEIQMVNDFDTHTLSSEAQQSHAAALSTLKAPGKNYFGDEEYGAMFAAQAVIRSQKFVDITPISADGIKVLSTKDLAQALLGVEPPLVLGVTSDTSAIPGTQALLGGGMAWADASADAALQTRFQGLLEALGAKIDRPLVFYSNSRNDWYSLNAALRARAAGYRDVGWYRGGMVAWKAASLPLARTVLRAVVQ